MQIEEQQITNKIYLLIFNTQFDVTSTFLRFQEHYESPKFRGKTFSLKEFKEWYTKNSPKGRKTGNFTYYTDWNGFNIPSYVLRPFFEGKFNPLSGKENQLLALFRGVKEPFYIIGIHKEYKTPDEILKHETAHGLFYTDENYKKEVLKVISKFNVEAIKQELIKKAGYHKEVLNDEVNAYSVESSKKIKKYVPGELREALKKLYKRYLVINKHK